MFATVQVTIIYIADSGHIDTGADRNNWFLITNVIWMAILVSG